jgi:hypothetical protein
MNKENLPARWEAFQAERLGLTVEELRQQKAALLGMSIDELNQMLSTDQDELNKELIKIVLGNKKYDAWILRRREKREAEDAMKYGMSVVDWRERKTRFSKMDFKQLEELLCAEQDEPTKKLIGSFLAELRKQRFASMSLEQLEELWCAERDEPTKILMEQILRSKYEEILSSKDYYELYKLKNIERVPWRLAVVEASLARCKKPNWVDPGPEDWRNG